jgi:hypothetical protein
MYSFFFVAVLFWMLDQDRRRKRWWIYLWIPLFVLWVNLHGGLVLGIGIVVAEGLQRFLEGRSYRHLVIVGLVMVALVSINPYGFVMYTYLLRAIPMERLFINEWKPIWSWWENAPFQLIVFILSFLIFIYAVVSRRLKNLTGLFPLLLLLLGAMTCMRLVFFYALAWLCFVPGYLKGTPVAEWLEYYWTRAPFVFLLVFSLFIGVFGRFAVSRQPWKVVVPAVSMEIFGRHLVYPVGPVDYLKRHGFKGNLMVYFPYGAYVSWNLYPQVRVSMDSRYEVAYPEWLVHENIEFYRYAKNWRKVLSRYPTDAVLVHRDSPLAGKMEDQEGWHLPYQDDSFLIYALNVVSLPKEDGRGKSLEGTFP